MVVLEEGSMLTSGHNQYLQPDYLSPLPTTLDAKKSPLALLAQTCSQIGADSPSKPLISSSLDKGSKNSATNNNNNNNHHSNNNHSSSGQNGRSPTAAKLERTRASPVDSVKNLAFKPYESTVLSSKRSSGSEPESSSGSRPTSKTSVHSASGVLPDCVAQRASASPLLQLGPTDPSSKKSPSAGSRTPLGGRKSSSPSAASSGSRSSPAQSSHMLSDSGHRKSPGARESPRNPAGASPIVRSGMEILAGAHAKDASASLAAYKAAAAAGFANPLCCPPGLGAADGPAGFRAPFPAFAAAAAQQQHAAAAAALLGYPGAPAPSPYLGYARVKTPQGGETLVPVCKDPYCTGCQYSLHNAQLMMAAAAQGPAAGACPSGCTQCDHQKTYNLMALSSLGQQMPPPGPHQGYPGASGAAAAGSGPNGAQSRLPHVCNWIAGDSYCGKRFASSEELFQHLRTSHASLAGVDPGAAALLAASSAAGPHHPLLSPSAALHRAAAAAGASYPAPSLSPLAAAAARYHPYGKPPTGPIPASLAASPFSAFNPLGPYYSPYAIYGQRIGAAVHQ